MRTLIGAAEPPERPRDGFTFTAAGGPTTSMVDTVLAFIGAIGVTVTPWQAVVIRQAYVGREHASPGCACGFNAAGQRFVDPICRRLKMHPPATP